MAISFPLHKKLFIIAFWSTLSISIWAQSMNLQSPFLWLIPTAIIVVSSIFIAHYLSDRLLPDALLHNAMRHFFVIATLMSLFLAFIIAITFTVFPMVIGDVDILGRDNLSTWEGLFLLRLCGAVPSAMAITTTMCGIRFYQEHNTIEKDHRKLKQEHLETQLKHLQDQINPHLMFNVLNHIYSLMQNNLELASTVLLKFSDILRYQLYECNHKKVLLVREVKYLQDFVAIEQIRWDDELQVNAYWEINNKQLVIAPLLLIPLIENAFKHVSRVPHTIGVIEINCVETNGELVLFVANTYNDKYKINKTQGGIGIANLKERLSMQYANRYKLIQQQNNTKYSICLTIEL
ncbi:sensor histidine kinase [Myroides sp. LJL119]